MQLPLVSQNPLLRFIQKLFYYPIIFAFSACMLTLIALVLFPGGIGVLAIIGGREVRADMFKAAKEALW
ncbi:hypothetical protein [Vibrio sonorensis]|uniref:hypothetical protein n=1 Tax=Vibrio sonorensis TaxID=1004316 RepID=UPI0008DB0AD0|nr:hypothetical protein [Vibrio sonorensis]